jgi:transglutaminase-like putative cysteine protease
LADRLSLRAVLAAAPAVAVVTYAWTLLEAPVAPDAFVAAGVLALAPALFSDWRWRLVTTFVVGATVLTVAFETWPHRGFRDAWDGLRDAPAVQAPFDPSDVAALHGLVVSTAFGLALVASLGAAFRRPWVVVAAVAAGVGFPAVLLEDAHAVLLGALALGSALWASLVLGAADVRRGVTGLALAGALVAVSGGAALAGLSPGAGRVDWRGWDPFAGGGTGDVRFLWDASYAGIDFPIRPSVMLRIRAPARAQYWRISTLETFTGNRWIEHLFPTSLAGSRQRLPRSALAPRRDARPGEWLRQEVTVVGLDDSRVPAATEPARIDAPSLGTVEYMQGGVMLAHRPLRRGEAYTVWSYAPRPTPRQLAAAPARYPGAADRYVELESARFPWFGVAGRAAQVDRVFRDDRYLALRAYEPLWEEARRLTAGARSPYEATLVLERWFRARGGFRYEEHPPASASNPPLVDFVEVTRAGYCQHYAGAMALMLRTLGVPARVAVGFTAGTWKAGVWTVTDQQAHAWVEAWFAGYGWLAFDPTPGRGTLSAVYTLASDSADAVRALGTGRFLDFSPQQPAPGAAAVSPAADAADTATVPWWLVALLLAPAALTLGVVAAKRARRLRRLRDGDPRRLAAGVRSELVDALVDRGAALAPDATPTELRRTAERVFGIPALSLTDAIAEARYGPEPRARPAAERARSELRRIIAATAARESPSRRVRAALSVRSLGPEGAR